MSVGSTINDFFVCLFVFFHSWINLLKVLIFALIVFTHLKKAVERNSQNIANNDQYYWIWEYLNVATNLKKFAVSFFKELQEKFHNESRFRVAILVQELIISDILMSLSEPKIEQHLKPMGGSMWKKGWRSTQVGAWFSLSCSPIYFVPKCFTASYWSFFIYNY